MAKQQRVRMRHLAQRAALVASLAILAVIAYDYACQWSAAAQPSGKKRPKSKNTQDLIEKAAALLDDVGGGGPPVGASSVAGAVPPDAPVADAAGAPEDAATDAAPDAVQDAAADAALDAPAAAAAVVDAPAPVAVTPKPPAAPKTRLPPRKSRKERFASGANVELKGPASSPLADLGIPPAAVPVVAAAATATAMGVWPFLMKTLLALLKTLLKSIVADRFKKRGKEGKKVNTARKAWDVLGLAVRPAELVHIGGGALLYGAAVYYTAYGFQWKSIALARQETLVLMFYLIRTSVRYVYERVYKISSEYRLWFTGGVMCIGSAMLGNPLSVMGVDLNSAKTAEEKARMVQMSMLLVFIALGMGTFFFLINQVYPSVFFQTATIACTGAALSDVLPVDPMTGKKVWDISKLKWLGLFAVVVPVFFLFNFVL